MCGHASPGFPIIWELFIVTFHRYSSSGRQRVLPRPFRLHCTKYLCALVRLPAWFHPEMKFILVYLLFTQICQPGGAINLRLRTRSAVCFGICSLGMPRSFLGSKILKFIHYFPVRVNTWSTLWLLYNTLSKYKKEKTCPVLVCPVLSYVIPI